MCETAERRVFPRYRCDGVVDILQGERRWGWGKVSEISRGGCYIETDHTLPVGDEVQLRITIAGAMLDIGGRVASATQLVGMGMDFVATSAEQESNLAQIVEKVAPVEVSPAAPPEKPPQPNSSTIRITREAAPGILAEVIKRINETGVLTRQELANIVKATQ